MLRVELFTQQQLADIFMGACFSPSCEECPEFAKNRCFDKPDCSRILADTLTDEAEPEDMINLMSDDCAELLDDVKEDSKAWQCAELAYITTRIHEEIEEAVGKYDIPVKPSQIAYMIYSNMLDEESGNE